MAKFKFSEVEKQSIEKAVKDLETDSCGEIVAYYVDKSDDYDEISWYLSGMIGFTTLLAFGILSYLWKLPFYITILDVVIFTLSLMLIGFLLPLFFPVLRVWMANEKKREMMSRRRAKLAFLDENVFQTEERVGILIFISRLEREVVVLGDVGINTKVEEGDWDEIVKIVTTAIKKKEISDGIITAIAQCKKLLLKNGFVRKTTDTNELSDGIRVEE